MGFIPRSLVLRSIVYSWILKYRNWPIRLTIEHEYPEVAASPFINRELRKWQWQQQREHHKSIIWLVEWWKIILQHTFWCNFLTWSAKRQHEIFIFEVLMTTPACILCLYMKNICAKQAKVHFAYFVQHNQHRIIAKHLT